MADQLDLVFKKVVNRQYTTEVKKWYEENPGVPFKLKGSDVWVDNIPEIPPVSDSAVIEGYRVANKLVMTKDISVNASKSWYADDAGTKLTGFISPRFGQGYTAELYAVSSGAKILTADTCGWFFDYESGNLTFDGTPPGDPAQGYEIVCYKYIGATADDLAAALEGSAWQDPVLSIAAEPSGTETGGERYLISDTPTPASVFDGHENELAEYDGVDWKFSSPIPGNITYVVSLDRLYVYDNNDGWAWSGIDAADLDYNNDDSDLNSLSVKDAIDELDTLAKTQTTLFWVDSNRADSYVETGSSTKPYKTLASAVTATTNGDSIHMVPGTYDGAGLQFANNVSVIGDSMDNTFIENDVIIGFDTTSSLTLENVSFNNQNHVILNNVSNLKNIKCNGRLTINSDCVGYNIDVDTEVEGSALTVNGGVVVLDLLTVAQTADQLSLNHVTGRLLLSTAKITGNRAASPVAVSESGSIQTSFTAITNAGGGKALVVNNSALAGTPNKFYDTLQIGGIDCNDAITIVEGVSGGNPTSTVIDDANLIYRGGTQLKNDSSIIKDVAGGTLIGKTINDSVDRVAQSMVYDTTHRYLVLEPCIDDV